MRFLCNNLAPICVAAVAATLTWLFGGTRSDYVALTVPWLLLLLAEVTFCFPQKHRGETSSEARRRVWKHIRRDPAVLVSVCLLLLLAVPFLNNGLCPSCDADLIALGHDPKPLIGFLPFCVDRVLHYNVFLWFAVALFSMIATRHALNHRGKRLVLEMIVWNGFALAILAFVQIASDAPGPLWIDLSLGTKPGEFFATWGYPNMAGDYFTTLFGLSVALWRRAVDDVEIEFPHGSEKAHRARRKLFWRRHLYLIPAAIFFFTALHTLSRAAIILVTISAVLYFFHAYQSFTAKMNRARRVKVGMFWSVILVFVVLLACNYLPKNLQREVDTLDTVGVLDRVTGRGQYHVRVATALWKDNWLFGCGGWGYKHLCMTKMTEKELNELQMVGGINVHNDYLQFLAEHGVAGFGALVAIVVLLLIPVGKVWHRLARAARFADAKSRPPKPVQIFVMSAPVFCILVSILATLIHSFGDCALRSPAVLTLFFISLASLTGFLPEGEQDSHRQ